MIGMEPTFAEHLDNLVAVFREVRRVLRDDGTLWLNYGDAYAHSGGGGNGATGGLDKSTLTSPMPPVGTTPQRSILPAGYKPKDLMLMPARVAMALQADGWWVRSEIIWHKPNPMPESCTDRPTSAHEKMFLMSKSAKYFYDAKAVRVALSKTSLSQYKTPYDPNSVKVHTDTKSYDGSEIKRKMTAGGVPSGANLRNVWKIATHAYSEAHFATFPPTLVEPCIKAGTSEKGVCSECGAPWVRNVEKSGGATGKSWHDHSDDMGRGQSEARLTGDYQVKTIGWSPSCEHDAEVVPATVIDPFGGSGTVGVVADRLYRDSILIDINPDYTTMAHDRIYNDAPLLVDVQTGAL